MQNKKTPVFQGSTNGGQNKSGKKSKMQ